MANGHQTGSMVVLAMLLSLLAGCRVHEPRPVQVRCELDEQMVRIYAERMHIALEELHQIEDQVRACLYFKKKQDEKQQQPSDEPTAHKEK